MMKKVLAIILSFILLISHVYLTIGTHFCGGKSVETKFMLSDTHLGCDMFDTEMSCKDTAESARNVLNYDNIPCCKNGFQIIQLTDDYLKNFSQIIVNYDFVVSVIYITLNIDLFAKSNKQFYTDYFPPPQERDKQVLFQTFLF